MNQFFFNLKHFSNIVVIFSVFIYIIYLYIQSNLCPVYLTFSITTIFKLKIVIIYIYLYQGR